MFFRKGPEHLVPGHYNQAVHIRYPVVMSKLSNVTDKKIVLKVERIYPFQVPNKVKKGARFSDIFVKVNF